MSLVVTRTCSLAACLYLAGLAVAHADPAASEPDLSALGLGPGDASFDDKLNLFGFADFTWQNTHFSTPSAYTPDGTTFMLGNLDLYAAKNLSLHARSLVEVRFMAAPNGAKNMDGTTTVTTTADATNFERPTEWGGIAIERAYVEYDLTSFLTVRAGHWLTPYGIWNTDHGSPVIIGAFRPYIIGEQLFPEHQTGLDLFGTLPVDEYKLTYHATISNGRNQTEIVSDTDRRPAFGGRLELEAPWSGTAKLGISGYAGRYTGANPTLTTSDTATADTVPAPALEAYDERGVGLDAQWDHGGLHLQGELIRRSRSYLDGHRPLTLFGAPQPDGTDFGIYALAGYRFSSLWNVMPFAFVEDYRPLVAGEVKGIKAYNLGLNFRPTSTLVLKLQGSYGHTDSMGLVQGDIFLTTAQVAWVF